MESQYQYDRVFDAVAIDRTLDDIVTQDLYEEWRDLGLLDRLYLKNGNGWLRIGLNERQKNGPPKITTDSKTRERLLGWTIWNCRVTKGWVVPVLRQQSFME